MAWESRNGKRYYYAKLRIGDKVTSVYLGTSPLAYEHADHVAQKQADRTQCKQEELEWTTLDDELDSLRAQIEALLQQAGLHRQNYGPWRKQTPRPSAPPA